MQIGWKDLETKRKLTRLSRIIDVITLIILYSLCAFLFWRALA